MLAVVRRMKVVQSEDLLPSLPQYIYMYSRTLDTVSRPWRLLSVSEHVETSDTSPRVLTRRWCVSWPAVTNYYYLTIEHF